MKKLLPTAIKPLLCIILSLFFSASCFATTYTFTGSGSWASSGNWQGGNIPPIDVPSTDTILINGTGDCDFDNPYDDLLLQVDGAFIIPSGKVFNVNTGQIRTTMGVLTVDGTLNLYTNSAMDYENSTVNIAGTVNVNEEDGLYSYDNSGSVNVFSTGIIHVNGFEIFVRGACNIAAGGLIEINSGGTYFGYLGMITNNGTIINGSGCTFLLGYANSLTNNGVFTNNGNFQKGGGTVTGTGTINGSGTMQFSYTNPVGATLSPGNSLGCTSIDGDFVNNGNLDIELADGSACTDYDQVQVLNGHNATIGGTINITFPSGVPTTTTFTIVTVTGAGSITNNSPTINWPAGYSGSGVVVGQSYQVSFTPPPATYTFTGSGNWSNSGNWSGGNIPPLEPGNTDTIIINGSGNCNFDAPYGYYLLQVHGAFILNAGKTLNINEENIRIAGGVFSVLGILNCNTYGSIDYDNGIVNISGTVNVNQEDGLYSVSSGVVNLLSTGAIHVNGGTMNIRGSGSIAAGGLLEINSGGRYDGYFGTFFNNGTMVNGTGCLIHLEYGIINNSGTFTNNGDVTHYTGAVTGTGMINGAGAIGFSFTNVVGATLSPGNSPGCTSIDGDFVNSGNLDIELADGTACTNYDQVKVLNGHNATIGGTINITFPSGVPTTTTFTIVTVTGTGSITNNSPTINWPAGYSGSGAVVGKSYQVSFGLLPVELVHFKAVLTDANKVALDWMTASETNNAAFHIERSTDSRNWENISTIQGNGTSLEQHFYRFMDYNPHHSLNYYRLKQEDFDGKYVYSKTVSVSMENTNGSASFMPNPTSGYTRLYIETNAKGSGSLKLYDIMGKIVEEMTIQQEGNQLYHELALNLPPGIYMTVLSMDGQEWKQRLVVE